MNQMFSLVVIICSIFIISCGNVQQASNITNYYSASFDTYYQLESIESAYTFNMVGSTGNILNAVPLTLTANGYTFSTIYKGQNATGNIVINNGQIGISVNSPSASFADFATVNTNSNIIPNDTYTTVCDKNNISACLISISNNQISISEYSISAESTILCSSQPLTKVNTSINPNLFSFTCGIQGATYNGIWYIMPLIVNNVVGFMISEYNASINANDDGTDEIAFTQAQFVPNGDYNYVYNSNSYGQSGISTATINSNGVINNIIGTCAGAFCALITGQYSGNTKGNPMIGFSYFSVNGQLNYNLVGNTLMNIYVDSYVGIYY